MKHLFVPYELAKKLKEKGFGGPCFGEYCKINTSEIFLELYQEMDEQIKYLADCAAPLYQQVVDWFREKHGLCIEVELNEDSFDSFIRKVGKPLNDYKRGKLSTTYYEALTKAIEEALKLI